MNKNFIQRGITCILGISLLAVVLFVFPHYNYAVFSVFVCVLSLLGTREMSKMLFSKVIPLSYFTWLLPASAYFWCNYSIVLLILISLPMVTEIKKGEKTDFSESLSVIAKKVLLVIYPSLFASYVVLIFSQKYLQTNSYQILFFLCLVFTNDIFAYIFGKFFGKNNSQILKVSPKKSVAGFIGGTLGSIVFAVIFYLSVNEYLHFSSIVTSILIGLCISIFANIGDLIESVFKRASKIKDSGSVVPGRGGVLDSIDSVIFCAPIFYLFLRISLFLDFVRAI